MTTTVFVLASLAKCVFALAFVMNIVPILIWAERKGAAYIQDRPGPNRADIMGIRAAGLVHTLNDVVKLVLKEDIVPAHVYKPFWVAAPIISMTVALMTFAVVPFGDELVLSDTVRVPLQVAQLNAGVLYILAITSLGVYGIMLAGWASNNKFSLLGGLRASAQMVSYELAMGFALVVMFMAYGTTDLGAIAEAQAGPIWRWGVFLGFPTPDQWAVLPIPVGLIAFVLLWVSVFAETNRLPFDMPEAEAELVAGYHTEYSSLRFALFFMAEYANMIVGSAVTATLFFGGYNLPFLSPDAIRANGGLVLLAAGLGGAALLVVFAVWALRRRAAPFYQVLKPGDPRLKEPVFWAAVWLSLAVVHLGIAGLGASGLVGPGTLAVEIVALVIHVSVLGAKVLFGCWVMIWVRWTLPRFRYDQVMHLGWRIMLPISVANVILTGIWLVGSHALSV